VPVSPLELVDDRFEKLAEELRAARPVAREALRDRVLALSPPPPPRFELRLRRFVPAAGLAGLAAALGVAGVLGIVHGSTGRQSTLHATRSGRPAALELNQARSQTFKRGALKGSASSRFDSSIAPSAQRLQQYDAFLRVRVGSQDELSSRTQNALRFTRKLGGYIVSAHYSAPGHTGTSRLALRVPIERVQAAIAHFSGYGTLVQQRIVLKDLQQHVDALTVRIRKLRAEIVRLEQQGASHERIDRARALLLVLTSRKSASVRRAQLASVALTMVVGAKKATVATPPGPFRRTIDDAGSVLLRELEILLYALLVAGPLLLLGGAGILAGRSMRRRADRRLLERA
jgi:hypothetical protein